MTLAEFETAMRATSRDYADSVTERVRAMQAMQEQIRQFNENIQPTVTTSTEPSVSQLFRHEQTKVRDIVYSLSPRTQVEERQRRRSLHAFERLQSHILTEAVLMGMQADVERDMREIEDMPSTQNLLWEYRRKQILLEILLQRERQRQDRLNTYVAPPLTNYTSYGEPLPDAAALRRTADQIRQIDPQLILKPLPRKMILDRG